MIPVETPEIDIDQLAGAVRGGAAIVDVREPGEYVAGHVPGAVLIPMGQLPGRVTELDRGATVYVVCASGNRSATMTHFLRSAGFDAYSVAGGTSGWGPLRPSRRRRLRPSSLRTRPPHDSLGGRHA